MGKKFTLSLLVLVATLLALPIQAQDAYTLRKAPLSKVMKDVKGRVSKKVYSFASLDGKQAVKEVVAKAKLDAREKSEVERIELAKLWNRNMSRVQERKNYNQKPNQFRELIAIQIPSAFEGIDRQAQPAVSRSRRTEAALVTPPATASVETWYTTDGAFYIYSQGAYADASSYMKTVNVAIDGSDIYIQGLGYWFKEGWIKGSIDATTATFANSQIIGEDEYGPEYIVGSNDGETLSDNIVFNYDAEKGVLAAVTAFILENAEASEVAPYCYWAQPSFSKTEPQGPAVVVVPEGIEAVDYVMSYTTGSTPVKVAVDGNDVYFQGMSSFIPDAWVKGTKDGNNVTFEANQYMGEYSGYESYFFYNGPATFVYDADADTYSATGQIYGVLGGQYYDGNYTNPVLNRVVEKAATPANPIITDLKNGNYGYYILFNVPLQDTDGNPLVASKLSYEIFTDVNQEVSPLTFTPATHTRLTENMTVIPYGFTEGYDFYDTQIYLNDLYSDSWNKIGIKSIYTGGGETHETEIQWYTIKPYGEPEATTAANVDELPYQNGLNTADAFAEFGVLDINNDNKTWSFSSSKKAAQYTYNEDSDGDDWLISPAIKLEAGKKYRFAIDVAAASAKYPERFEVKMGIEPKVSALTTEVIPSTVVDFAEFATLDKEVTVSETGYYHFGVHAISDADEYFLFVKNFLLEAVADPAAPAAVSNFEAVPTEDKLEVTVSFTAPTQTVGGDALSDLGGFIIRRDGKTIKNLSSVNQIAWTAADQGYANEEAVESIAFGDGITGELAAGGNSNAPKYYNSGTALRMYANNTLTIKGSGIKKVTFTLTGNDKQKKLAADKGDYALEGNIGTWTGAADEIVFSVPDGSGNQARIQAIEIESAGTPIVAGADYSYVDNDNLTVGRHTYQVIAYNAAGNGLISEEKAVSLSIALGVPASFDLSQEEVFGLFQVIDANADDNTWRWNASNGTYYSYSTAKAADDYLVSTPVKLEAGKNYRVVVTASCSGEKYPEAFRVLVGKEATIAGLNKLVADTTWVATEEEENYEAEFTASEDGNFYVAIHAVSPANMWNLFVSSLAIEKGAEPTAPAAVTEFAAVAGEKGALEVNVSFNAPAKAINGTDLTDNLTINVLRDGEVVKTFEAAAPGSSLNWKDENVEQSKTYVYQVVASNASGAGLKSDKVSVYVGFDVPADLANLTATDNATSIKFAWDKVGEVGATGGYVNPAAVDYEVWSLKIVESIFGQSLDYDQLIASETDKDNYVLAENTDEGEQDYKYWAVQPVNVAGVGTPAVASMLVGAPYTLPFFESFTGSAFHYIWDYSSNAGIFVSEESSDDDAVALQLTALDEPGTVDIFTGKVSLKNAANPTLLFDVKSATVSKISVIGSVEGGAFTSIQADAPVTSEYTTIKVPLNDLKDARFVQLGFSADFANATIEDIDWNTYQYVYTWGDLLTIDNIRIVDLYEHDVEVALNAPASVVAGSAAKLQVKVSNNAENAANGFTLKLTAGEKEIYNKTFNEALKPFSSIDVEAAFETTVFDEAGDVTLTAEVVYENDLNPDNNADEAVITVKEPTATAPSNLVAEQTAEQAEKGEVTLTWTAPAEGAAQEVTEDFTAYENGANETGMVGEWTLVNANGKTKGSLFQDLELANDGLAKAWQVFNPEAYGITNPSFNGPNGSLSESYLISGYNLEGQTYPDNDDWLISPVLTGIAQEISFDISALDVQYGPSSYEVLASSTDTELASFTKVAGAELTTAGWGKVTAQLPEGTKYFAIRNNTPGDGALCVCLANITFQKGGAKAESFNIYVDAATAGNTTEATAILKELAAGNHVFAVTAVYANGAESKPVTATLDVTNAINEILSSGKSFTIYTVDGKLINRQATNLNGLKGSYIINNKKVILK